MLIRLNAEQEMLQASIRALGQKHGTAGGSASLDTVSVQHVWDELTAIGVNDMLEPQHDEPWGGAVEAVVVAMELARWVVPTPFIGRTVMAKTLVDLAGGEADVATCAISARLADPLVVPGTPAICWDAAGGDSAVWLQPSKQGPTALLYNATPTDTVEQPIDLTRRAATITSTAGVEIGEFPADSDALTRWQALALTALAADIVGVMDGGLAMASAYALARKQFDRPIGSFQAVQHLLAEQHVALRAARIATYYAAWCVQELTAGEALQAARVAKAYASEAGVTATEAVIQIHGGIGFTWEHAAHLFLRRAIYCREVLGDEQLHYRAYLSTLLESSDRPGRPERDLDG